MNGLMEKLLVARLEQFAVANMSFRSIQRHVFTVLFINTRPKQACMLNIGGVRTKRSQKVQQFRNRRHYKVLKLLKKGSILDDVVFASLLQRAVTFTLCFQKNICSKSKYISVILLKTCRRWCLFHPCKLSTSLWVPCLRPDSRNSGLQ